MGRMPCWYGWTAANGWARKGTPLPPIPTGCAANCWICRTQAQTNCTAAGFCRKNSAAYMRKPPPNCCAVKTSRRPTLPPSAATGKPSDTRRNTVTAYSLPICRCWQNGRGFLPSATSAAATLRPADKVRRSSPPFTKPCSATTGKHARY